VSGLVFNFNLGLENALQSIALAYPNTDITQIDTFSLLDDLYLNPAAHGLSNVSDACYSAYVVPGGTACANPDQYIFWDLDHPTSATHRILAADMLRSIPEPGSVALMCMGLVALAIAGKRGRSSTNQISVHA
jgi:phospholipase/lecithinase/hemolysin